MSFQQGGDWTNDYSDPEIPKTLKNEPPAVGNISRHAIHGQMTDLKRGKKVPQNRGQKSTPKSSLEAFAEGGTVTQLG
jgi:hypothetical protein